MKPVDPSTWRFGIPSDSIVRDAPEDGPAEASESYYGGRLVAESMDVSEREFILRACKAHAGLIERVSMLEEAVGKIDQTLRVPAAEYVPAIGDVFSIIDSLKSRLNGSRGWKEGESCRS